MNKLNKHQVFGGILLGFFTHQLFTKSSGFISAVLKGGLEGFLKWLALSEVGILIILILSSIFVIKEKPKHFIWLLVGFLLWVLLTIKDLYFSYTMSIAIYGDFQFNANWSWFMNRGIFFVFVLFFFFYCLWEIHKENELNKPLQSTAESGD